MIHYYSSLYINRVMVDFRLFEEPRPKGPGNQNGALVWDA